MSQIVEFDKDIDSYRFECPHCKGSIQVGRREINCKIFRHGALKINGQGINPHAPKEECDKLIAFDLIHGCGKPFQLYVENGQMFVAVCDYV